MEQSCVEPVGIDGHEIVDVSLSVLIKYVAGYAAGSTKLLLVVRGVERQCLLSEHAGRLKPMERIVGGGFYCVVCIRDTGDITLYVSGQKIK